MSNKTKLTIMTVIKKLIKFFFHQNEFHADSYQDKPVSGAQTQTHTNEQNLSLENIPEKNVIKIENSLTEIGNINSICPYCATELTKRPSKKSKCPNCGQYIYVRTRPIDRHRVLVTLKQAEEIESQWANFRRIDIYDYIAPEEIEDQKKQFFEKKGVRISDFDAKWSILNKQLIEHSKNANWGLYRNARLAMASVREQRGKLKDSLKTYLEVCYYSGH